jgi:2-oxo-4-hydroxy-4-carboxy-5-ureidoimidazoline decarboxylase
VHSATETTMPPLPISEFDAAPMSDAAAELHACCASRHWIVAVLAERPYRHLAALIATSDRVLTQLQWSDVEEALAAHPRIGRRVSGERREAAWSRAEQSGTRLADSEMETVLLEGNLAYEQRFGHLFLICASGHSAAELLDALRSRLANSVEVERDVVRAELAKIVRLRLAKAFQ